LMVIHASVVVLIEPDIVVDSDGDHERRYYY